MPFYHYQAIDKSGKEISDHLEAQNEGEVMQILQQRNMTILEVKTVADKRAEKKDMNINLFGGAPKVPILLVLTFYEQLGFLIKAGIPIFLAIKMLGDQLKHPRLEEILKTVLFELSEGFPLSLALQKFPESFPPLHTNLIGVGEKSGNLDGALAQLVELTQEQQEIRGKIVKAAAYPIFLLSLCLALVMGLLMFMFPQFEEIFKGFGVKLPFLTQFFIDISHQLRNNTIPIFGGLGAVIGSIIYFFKSDATSETRDKMFLSLPLIKDVFVAMFVALFAKTLSSLLKSGIPLLDGLRICQETIRGEAKRKFFEKLITSVKEGEPVSKAMEGSLLIPDMALQLFIVGEKTGHIDKMLENTFLYYKKQYNELLQKVTAVLQPALLFFSAVLICMVAISVFVPLFKLSASSKGSGE